MSFSILIGLGAALGLAWVALRSLSAPGALRDLPGGSALVTRFLDGGLWGLLGGLAGGRALHVAAAWPYFSAHPFEIPQVWLGGLSGPGSALGALVALSLYARGSGLPFGALADALLPLAASVSVSAWLACWSSGCAYGSLSGWGIPAVDEWGEMQTRIPVQLFGALLSLLLYGLLDRWLAAFTNSRRVPLERQTALKYPAPGVVACAMFFLLSAVTAGLSLLRADSTPLLLGLRLDALAWAALAFFSPLGVWLSSLPSRKAALLP